MVEDVGCRILDDVGSLQYEVLQLPSVGIVFYALCDDAETIQVHLLILSVIKVIPVQIDIQDLANDMVKIQQKKAELFL